MITKLIEAAIGIVIVGVVLTIIAIRALSGLWSSCEPEPRLQSTPVGTITVVEVGS